MDDIIPENVPQKQCSKCNKFSPATFDFFPRDKRNKDGLNYLCKECVSEYHKKLRREGPDEKAPLPDGYKCCATCKELIPASPDFFQRDRYKPDGFTSSCKQCKAHPRKVSIDDGFVVDGMKKCAMCQKVLPATTEYFSPRKERNSFRPKCKACQKIIDAQRQRPKVSKEANQQRYLVERARRLRQREAYYRAHVEDYRLYYKQYRQTHIEQCRANGHNRRARERSAPGKHNAADLKKLFSDQKGKCYYCKATLKKGKHGYHVDHVIPLSRGGSNGPENLVITCPACNLSKKDKLPHEWPKGGKLL